MKVISYLLLLVISATSASAQGSGLCQPIYNLVKYYHAFDTVKNKGDYKIADLPTPILEKSKSGFYTYNEATAYYLELDKQASYHKIADNYKASDKVLFINPFRYGRDLLPDIIEKNKLHTEVSIFTSNLSDEYFDIKKDDRINILPIGLIALCQSLLGDSSVTFINNPLQVSVVNGTVNFNPNFIKWLYILHINEVRLTNSTFNKFVTDQKEMDSWCNERTRVRADYGRFYDRYVTNFSNSLQFLYTVGKKAAVHCDPLSNDCINNIEIQTINQMHIQPTVYQKLIDLAYNQYGNSTDLGIYIKGDIGSRFGNAHDFYAWFDKW